MRCIIQRTERFARGNTGGGGCGGRRWEEYLCTDIISPMDDNGVCWWWWRSGRDRTGNHAHQQPEAVEDLRRDHEPNRSLLRFRLTNTSTYGACCILRCAPGGLSSWTAAATAMAPNHGPLVEMGAWSGEETEGPRASIINGSCTQLKRIDLEKKKPFIFQLATGGKAFGKWMNIFKLIWKEIEYFKRVLGYLGNNVIFVFVEIKRLNGFLSLSISLKVRCVSVFLLFSPFFQFQLS